MNFYCSTDVGLIKIGKGRAGRVWGKHLEEFGGKWAETVLAVYEGDDVAWQ